MNLGQSIRSGVKWLAFGKVGNRLFEFAFGVALARLLVPADFGMIVTIQIFTGFVGMFTAGGMGQSLIRARHADADDFTAVFTLQLGVGMAVYAGFFVGAPFMARFFDNPLYTDLVRVSALSFLLRPLVTMRNAWLNREMNFRSRTLVDVATAFFGGAISVAMAVAGLGVWSLVLAGLFGALFNNFWLARLAPFQPRLNFSLATMRKHAGYGARIVGTDFIDYIRAHSRTLIVSKMAGPAFLGLFNKADSLSRLPNQLLMSPTMEPLFRAMSKTQDDVDQVKYMFYRAITLLMAYTAPAYVLLWWVAEPFIVTVYGVKWIDAGAPMSVLTLAAFCLNVVLPCSVLLAARNLLGKEMVATAINIPVTIVACLVGLRWGLVGVAWGVVVATAVQAIQFYALVLRALPTRAVDLLRAATPGLVLGALTFGMLALLDWAVGDWQRTRPALYVLSMSVLGGAFAVGAFLLLPLPALRSEAARWRALVADRLAPLRRGQRVADSADPTDPNRPATKGPTMLRRLILWTLPLALLAALLYSARADLEPHARRALAAQWRHFAADPLPVDAITQVYDMGVTDADGDGRLDLYTSNHNYRQFLFVATGDGRYEDVFGRWKLDQSPALPGAEQNRYPPRTERAGLYVYWLGDTLRLQFHRIDELSPVKGRVRLYKRAEVVRNDGVELRERVERAGEIEQSTLEFTATRSGTLVLYLDARGAPVNFLVDAPWARTHTYVGADAVVPTPYAGLPDAAAAAASAAADRCAACVEFELTLLDRHSMAWSDFNGDGIPDVLINRGALSGTLRSFPPEVRDRVGDELLLSQAPGRFVDRARELGIEKKDCSGRHVRLVDVDRDGRLDIFINCQERGTVAGVYPKQLWRQRADGRFEDVAAQVGLDLPDREIVDAVWFDADGDGLIDLFTHEDSGYFLYRQVGGQFQRQKVHTGPFHRASVPGLKGNVSDYWQFDGKLSVADFDADGRLDVFVASKRGNVLLANRGDGRFESVAPASVGLPAASVAAAWVDVDNDGRMDLHIVPEGLYRQDAAGRFVRTGLLALPQAKYQAAIVNWFDRDNDGAPDVIVALQDNASLWRWWEKLYKGDDVKGKDDRFDWPIQAHRNLSRGGHWLQLDLQGPPGNPSAIGAQVTLTTKAGRQARQVGSHEGSVLSQGHYRLYFGVGDEAGPLKLDIRWPDGAMQTIDGVAVDQRLRLRHPGPGAGRP